MKDVGIIYGTVGVTRFNIAISRPDVKKNDYVQVKHPNCGMVLGQITDIMRESDLTFETAKKMSSGEKVKYGQRFSGTVTLIGYRDDMGNLQMPRTPLNAGDRIFNADDELIKKVLGLKANIENGAYIGLLKGHSVRVYLDINTLVQKHVSILAKTGGGKSYMVGVFVEEMLKRMVPVVIMDPHGEYSSMMHPNTDEKDMLFMDKFGVKPRGYAEQIVEFSPDTSINPMALPLRFSDTNLEVREIIELAKLKKTGSHVGVLQKVINELKSFGADYTLREIIEMLRDTKHSSKWQLINSLEYLNSTGLFGEPATKISNLVRKGQCSIINLKGVPPDIQEIVVARVASKLFDARKLGKVPALMLIVEEAHNYCPQQAQAVSSKILRTIASEGRKFGLGLCVVTQRPAKIDKNVLSQCNTQIILKITNPNDLKAISSSIEGLTHGMEEDIQSLPIGVALISGGDFSFPIQTEIRPRETRHGGKSVDILGEEKIEDGEIEEEDMDS